MQFTYLYFFYHANLWRPPTAARQRQAVYAQRTGCVQARHTLFAFVSAISFPSPLPRRPSIAACALLAARTLLAGNAVGALLFVCIVCK